VSGKNRAYSEGGSRNAEVGKGKSVEVGSRKKGSQLKWEVGMRNSENGKAECGRMEG